MITKLTDDNKRQSEVIEAKDKEIKEKNTKLVEKDKVILVQGEEIKELNVTKTTLSHDVTELKN